MNRPIRIAIAGWGNVGKAALEAVHAGPDMEVAGVIRRVSNPIEFDVPVVSRIDELEKVDVVILALPSRMVGDAAEFYMKRGISTVDSFDIHTQIGTMRERLHLVAKANGVACIISAGWDPGSDSVVRALMQSMAPKGITHTNFGPGMSMGHTVAVKAIGGVKDALSITIPTGESVHRRMVYIEKEEGANFSAVSDKIKKDPYFAHDETLVYEVPSIDELKDVGHGVNMVRKGVSGVTNNQNFSFNMSINNPALTGQVLANCARAVIRQNPGCYTMIEVPVVDLLPGDRDQWVNQLV